MNPNPRYSRLPLPSLSLSVLLCHSVTSLNPSLVSHWLSFFLHVSAFAASRHLFHISHGVYSPGPSFLFSLTDPLITLIGFSGVVGSLVISGLLAPAARLSVNFISLTVTLNI